MRIVSRNCFDLLAGLQEARRLNRELYRHWAPRRARWLEQQARLQRELALRSILLVTAGLAGLLLVVTQLIFRLAGAHLLLTPWSIFLLTVLGGTLAVGLLFERRARRLGSPRFAAQPAPELQDIEAAWWQALAEEARRLDEQYAKANPRHGDEGEALLMNALQKALPDTFIGVRGFKGVAFLDTDVLVLGPNGIWVLDSKYWNGEVLFTGGRWHKIKRFRAGSQLVTREEEMDDIDYQWKKEASVINRVLVASVPGWRFRMDGGIVLTHPGGFMRADEQVGVAVRDIEHWIAAIRTDPPRPEMNETACLKALDMLLTVSYTFYQEPQFSSRRLARALFARQARQLTDWYEGKTSTALVPVR